MTTKSEIKEEKQHDINMNEILLDYAQNLAKCDLPNIFQDEHQLQNYRSKRYPGAIKSDSYVVGFPHLHKVGGSSLKSMLRDQAKLAGKDVRSVPHCREFCTNNNYNAFIECTGTANYDFYFGMRSKFDIVFPEECKKETMKSGNAVMYGHANYAEMEHVVKELNQHEIHYVTMFREPASRYESLFRFTTARDFAKSFDDSEEKNIEKLQEKFDEFISGFYKKHEMVYLSQNAPMELLQKFGKRNFDGIKSQDWQTTLPSKELQCGALDTVLQNMLDNYAVIGILERIDDVLEVLRCRFPWFKEQHVHHKNPTEGFFKEAPLKRREDLLEHITPIEKVLFEMADRILTADLENCRIISNS